VRVGKLIELSVEASDQTDAKRRVEEMCERLLANPVIESFEVTIS
jgi:phosphoribosylformylglycinamidine synthase